MALMLIDYSITLLGTIECGFILQYTDQTIHFVAGLRKYRYIGVHDHSHIAHVREIFPSARAGKPYDPNVICGRALNVFLDDADWVKFTMLAS